MEDQREQNQAKPKKHYHQNVVFVGKKNVGIAFLLALIFGPFGLLYVSIEGGIIMFLVSMLFVGLTNGIVRFLPWVICISWAVVAAMNKNEKLANIARKNINANPSNPLLQQSQESFRANQLLLYGNQVISFLSKNKKILIGAMMIISIAFVYYEVYLTPDPVRDGKNVAKAICRCFEKNADDIINSDQKFLSSFDLYKFKSKEEATAKLQELQNPINIDFESRMKNARQNQDDLLNKYVKDESQLNKFDFAYKTEIGHCHPSNGAKLYSITTDVTNKIATIKNSDDFKPNKEDTARMVLVNDNEANGISFSGDVGNLNASYKLEWNSDGTINGSYFYPSQSSTIYSLKGRDLGNGNIQLTEYTGNNISANCNLIEQGNCYVGKMNNTDGRNFNMTICSPAATVKSDKTYFYETPNGVRKPAYCVTGDQIYILKEENGFVYTEFPGSTGAVTKGWIVASDLNFSNNSSTPGRFPQASERLLSTSDLNGLNKTDLIIMRNEIFARHGYIFQTPEMKSYFATQSWYNGQYNDVTSMLTDIEKQNIDLIKKYK